MIYLNSNGSSVRVEQDGAFLENIPVSRFVSKIISQGNAVVIKNGTEPVASDLVENIFVKDTPLTQENASNLLGRLSRHFIPGGIYPKPVCWGSLVGNMEEQTDLIEYVDQSIIPCEYKGNISVIGKAIEIALDGSIVIGLMSKDSDTARLYGRALGSNVVVNWNNSSVYNGIIGEQSGQLIPLTSAVNVQFDDTIYMNATERGILSIEIVESWEYRYEIKYWICNGGKEAHLSVNRIKLESVAILNGPTNFE